MLEQLNFFFVYRRKQLQSQSGKMKDNVCAQPDKTLLTISKYADTLVATSVVGRTKPKLEPKSLKVIYAKYFQNFKEYTSYTSLYRQDPFLNGPLVTAITFTVNNFPII